MNSDNNFFKDNLYFLEREFESIYLLSEIIKDFNKYNADIIKGTDKMNFLVEILAEKCGEYKRNLAKLTPKFVEKLDKV